ncbi:MAG: ABC transporter ATP-binding protein [Desulfobacteraceae bacterium]
MGSKVSQFLIKTEDLVKDYTVGSQAVHALRGVSVEVKHGEFVAVMGPSGSGKSTLLHLLGCLDTPTSGRYFLDGEDVSSLTRDQLAGTRNRKIGFVFQTFNLLARATAIENVGLALIYGHTPRSKRRKRTEGVLGAVGLSDRTHHQPSQLSGGQQQRVAIARAIVNNPALILADEPTGALDTRTGLEIMALFQRLNRHGMTVVLVTHEPEIVRFASRILRFRDGCVISDEIVESPSDAEKILAEMPVEQEDSCWTT